jgi:TolB-like protein/Flp pilus assembly protein TadD
LSFIEELKRRNVFRVGIAYVVASWLLLQVADILVEALEAPAWTMRIILVVMLIGFPLALFFAWAFELTPEGIKKESEVDRSQSITNQTGRKLDFTIIFVLVVALGYFAYDKFILRTGEAPPDTVVAVESSATPEPEPEPTRTLPTDRSIAVLPFENRSMNEEDKYFTSGIHDDLLTQLAQISSLRVISRTSVAQFEDTDKSVLEIAELLNVATILEGGVQRAGNQVRINLQLIDAATDAHLWAQTYDRELTANNIFVIQSEIATAVTQAMRATLTPDEVSRIAEVPTDNMEALEEFFKGRAEMDTRTLPAIESARMRFERARTLDPDFAQAYAGETQAILLLSDRGTSYGDIPSAETIRLGRPLMEKAYELAPNDPMVLAVYGLLERQADDPALSTEYYDRSLAIDPNNGEVLNWKRMNLFLLGRNSEALGLAMQMVEADPMSMITLFNGIATIASFDDGHPDLVAELLDRMEVINPARALDTRAWVEEANGRLSGAARYYFASVELSPQSTSTLSNLGELLARLGLYAEAANVDPEAPEYNAFYQMDWEENLRLNRENQQRSADGRSENLDLIQALFRAGEYDEALERFAVLWGLYDEDPAQMNYMLLVMAEAAQKTERPAEFRTYRDAGAIWVQSLIESGGVNMFRHYAEARLAALDQREDDALNAVRAAINRGMRWDGWFLTPAFEHLEGNFAFQTELARMQELAAAEQVEILKMLCGPDPILNSMTPAPETCRMWEDLQQPTSGAPT